MQVERYNSYSYIIKGEKNQKGTPLKKDGWELKALTQEEMDAFNSGKVYGRLEKVDLNELENRPTTGMWKTGFYMNSQEYLKLLGMIG